MNAQLEPLVALLRRYPFGALSLVILLGCGVGVYFLSDDIDLEETARLDRANEGEAMLELLKGGSTQRQELAAVRDATRRIEENLINDADLAGNQWYFYRIEEQTKTRLLELHPQSSPTNDNTTLYKRVPYSLRVSGTYEQVAAYLLALETGPRLTNISSFNFSRRDKEASGGVVLELTLELLGKK